MCYGRCVKYTGYKLLILAVLCIVANVLLYFPNGETIYASHNQLSKYVGCLHGIIGGGLLVLIPAFAFIGLEHDHFHGCVPHENYRRNCALLASVIVACVGIFGAGYCFIISALALAEGPYCYCEDDRVWCYPFSHSAGGYLPQHPNWTGCREPRNVFTWNVTLFSILLVLSGIELIICIIQVIHGCIGGAWVVCHTHKEEPGEENTEKG
ncbi:transmembrane 4 L6 family member 1-like [Elgaria multicarinata webbii]|uniref:transmembrane 4 L6 family member 1-like n=1 Tax=Elgaria multicarinata webbii TaxID=159646 RepID=UPI002FCD0D62